MREVQGLIAAGHGFSGPNLKRQALLFDSLVALGLDEFLAGRHGPYLKSFAVDIDFLRSANVLSEGPLTKVALNSINPEAALALDFINEFSTPPEDAIVTLEIAQFMLQNHFVFVQDLSLRASAANHKGASDAVPIYQTPLTQVFLNKIGGQAKVQQDVLSIGLSALPVPDDTCSWQDILDFKTDAKDKPWAFHWWLSSLAAKNLTEAEIREENAHRDRLRSGDLLRRVIIIPHARIALSLSGARRILRLRLPGVLGHRGAHR